MLPVELQLSRVKGDDRQEPVVLSTGTVTVLEHGRHEDMTEVEDLKRSPRLSKGGQSNHKSLKAKKLCPGKMRLEKKERSRM